MSELAPALAPEEIPTPHLRVDGAKLRVNIDRVHRAAADHGAALRPHFKTHRSLSIAALQLGAGALGLTCATGAQVVSAQTLTDNLLFSSAIQLDPATWPTLREILTPDTLFVAASTPSLQAIRNAIGPDATANVLLEVDVGCDRGGLDPDECPDAARAAERLGLSVRGALAYPGQGYQPGRQAEAAATERRMLDESAAALTRAGYTVEHLSAGSTPTLPHVTSGSATEFRPGTYVFGDVQQVELGSIEPDAVSLTVVATVLAHRDGQIVLDAGGKALGRDHPPWLDGYGRVAGHWDWRIAKLYDHHSILETFDGGPDFAIGERVALVPNNVNSAMALRRGIWVDDGAATYRREPLIGDW